MNIKLKAKLQDKIENAKTNIDSYKENTSYILRIIFKGRTPLHSQISKPEEIEQLSEYFNEGQLNQINFTWIDRIEIRTHPDLNMEQIKKASGFPSEILKTFEELESNSEKIEELIKDADADFISHQAKRELEISRDDYKEMIEKAKWMLFDLLIKENR